jgi:beta-glucanase (GH16 family)
MMFKKHGLLLGAFLVLALGVTGLDLGRAHAEGCDWWKLVWSDEFNAPNGSPVNPSKWVFDIGAGGWGNKELEYYTDRLENVHQEDGNLMIKAIKEDYQGSKFTSARIKTLGKFEQKYGRFEARIKIPEGQGIWPAFWMMGNDITTVEWPNCGEIDIMENIGREPDIIHGTCHGPGYNGADGPSSPFKLENVDWFCDDYHLYAIEWDSEGIRWSVDGHQYKEIKPENLQGKGKWVFDHPFFILLNVAVGGSWPGAPDGTTKFPQSMAVDYVRVYQR